MRKIGLIDVDGKNNYPNLALMKISTHHKYLGDNVEFVFANTKYDKVYASKVFTFTADYQYNINCDDVNYGGTGYKNFIDLPDEIEHCVPDYDLYNCKSAYGFLTRGCIRNCSWCVVPKKEGSIRANADILEFLGDKKSAIIMDNNVLASDFGLKQIEKIIDLKIKVDFNQGLDARIIANNPDIAKMLSKVKWFKPLRMACDTLSQMDSIIKAVTMLREYGCKPSNYFIYVLVKEIPDALERVEMLKELKLDPFCQPYRNFENNTVDHEAKKFSRWVNHKAIFKTVEWCDYNKKGF